MSDNQTLILEAILRELKQIKLLLMVSVEEKPSKPSKLEEKGTDGRLAERLNREFPQIGASQPEIDEIISNCVADARQKWGVREDRDAELKSEDYTGNYKVTPSKDIPPLDISKAIAEAVNRAEKEMNKDA